MKKILVVEDDPNIGALIALTLRCADYSVRVADSGEAALDALAGDTPDLVVLDILMPPPDGWELYRIIRGTPACQRTRVLFLSALPVRPAILAANRVLANDRFMAKPFDLDDLRSLVRELLDSVSDGAREEGCAGETPVEEATAQDGAGSLI